MVAFRPISPSAALHIIREIAPDKEAAILCSFVEGGVIRAYARLVETLTVGAGQSEVRDAQIPRPLWKRIVADAKTDDVLATGSVKLAGDGLVGGRPDVMIIGVRFNEDNVREAVRQHGPISPPPAPSVAVSSPIKKPLPKIVPTAGVDTPPLIEIMETPPVPAMSAAPQDTSGSMAPPPPLKRRVTLPDGDAMVSIADAMAILGVSRGTIGNLVKRGKLEATSLGARTVIPTHSIRALMAGGSR